AQAIDGYVVRFLTSPEGTFYASQDADLGAHGESQAFVEGAEYYALNEKQRLIRGVPWIDRHVYPQENGLMIAALVRMHEADAGDSEPLDRARRALDQLILSHLRRGAVLREPNVGRNVRYLV